MNMLPIVDANSNAILFNRAESIAIGVRFYSRNPNLAAKF
jgi:hypothetical protein